MSRSFTSRPAVTNSRGRGRGAQTRTPQPVNIDRVGGMYQRPDLTGRGRARPMGMGAEGGIDDVDDDETRPGRNQANDEVGQRMTYQGGYTLIAPNQRKREQITEVAQRETQAYQAHKQRNTPKHLHYVGTAGGGQISQQEARRELIKATPTKITKLLQNQERKSYFKQKEEEEIQQKKAEQRQKALDNERRQKEQEERDSHRWDEQRRRQNEAFLNRLEKKNITTQNENTRGAQACSSVSTLSSKRSSTDSRSYQSTHPVSMATRNFSEDREPAGRQSEAENQKVMALSAIYPHYTRSELVEILKAVDYSLDNAISVLSD